MRRPRSQHGFLLCFLLSLLLNFEWSIPAWILLALHFWLKISLWWFAGTFGLWILIILVSVSIISWANRCSADCEEKTPENKNPYSVHDYPPGSSEPSKSNDEGLRRD